MHYFDKIKQIIDALRTPKTGCPWDLEQTHESLKPYLVEECYELLHALSSNKDDLSKEELGDVLLQVLLHARLFEEKKKFSIKDVCENLSEKIVRRHPHVFGESKNKKVSMTDLHEQWEEIKKKEGKKKGRFFPEKYLHLPSLQASHKIGEKSKELDFDWDNPIFVIEKVQEELNELKHALNNKEDSTHQGFGDNIEEELGDFLFSAAQLARHLDHNSEVVLAKANQKFYNRFNKMIQLIEKDGSHYESISRKEKESYWRKVKQSETN